ncbi:hypothetical protein PPYR_10932 [Photinus pyralis]|uniref:Uncharacterized protein n=1 Tax=Photinus pyralis TaxID=7054 RepID=A0A1Y1JUK6_PHOPY|nr:uncharacterized protein LOC116174219 [Photinus pyralis]XP_031347974.1 uncharacterized protein LOC116174219 [Photinus pyralis]KAB0796871.1 hypothetical protein PPYR_10932 [Photinus pyralis]
MDFETGEAVRDEETGEMLVPAVNLETGETEINSSAPDAQTRCRKFRIANLVPSKQEADTVNEYITSDMMPCLIFLFCATLFLNPIVIACMGAFEICLHVWAHKKNKKLTSANICYQSPLHIFVCEFCGKCKEERAKKKITNLQDKRNYKFIKYSIDCSQGIVM